MTSEALKALAERVEGANGADREIDCRLSHHFDRDGITYGTGDDSGWAPAKTVDGWDEAKWASMAAEYVSPLVPRFTSSIDAALGLVERVLPGWTVGGMRQGDNKLWTVELREGFATSYGRVVIAPSARGYNGAPLPIAILAALLRALLAKGE